MPLHKVGSGLPVHAQVMQKNEEQLIQTTALNTFSKIKRGLGDFSTTANQIAVFNRMVAKFNDENPTTKLRLTDENTASSTASYCATPVRKIDFSDPKYLSSPTSLIVNQEHRQRYQNQRLRITMEISENKASLKEILLAAQRSSASLLYPSDLSKAEKAINRDTYDSRIDAAKALCSILEYCQELSGFLVYLENQGIIPKPKPKPEPEPDPDPEPEPDPEQDGISLWTII